MRIYSISARDLNPTQIQVWTEILRSQPALDSPFLHPAFARLAASIWDRVHIGIFEDGGALVGFFPFERYPLGMGRPVAPMISDYQGVIVRNDVEWSVDALMDGCRLSSLEFDHLIASQSQFERYHSRLAVSSTINLASGYEAYERGLRERGSEFQTLGRKRRKFEREVGAIRVEVDTRDAKVLEWLVKQKSDQCAEKGYTDALTVPGIGRFVDSIRCTHTDDFAGVLSVLYVGDQIAAAHMGMRSRSVWHYWFPVYDPRFARYSPGLLLLLDMARAAEEIGVSMIDLGKGDAPYKERLRNGTLELAEARVEGLNGNSALARAVGRARGALRKAAWSAPLRRLYRRIMYR